MLSLFLQYNADADDKDDRNVIVLKYVLKQNVCLNLMMSEFNVMWLFHSLLTRIRVVAKNNTNQSTFFK